MTIGKLNTFHFFPYASVTFNERVEAGIERGTEYFAPRYINDALSDLVRVQAFNGTAIFLRAYDNNSTMVAEQTLTETSTGIWEYEGTFTAPANDVYYTYMLGTKPAGVWTPSFRTDPILHLHNSFGTVLMQIANENNYAGIDWRNNQIYSIRLDAKFFEERNVETNESEPLSDETVEKLSGSVKRQKYLEPEPWPPYMLNRVALALKCNTLALDGELFVQEEPYQQSRIGDRFGLFASNVWLTYKLDNFDTNVYGALNTEFIQTGSAIRQRDCVINKLTYLGNQPVSSMLTFIPNDNLGVGWGCIKCSRPNSHWRWDSGDAILWDDGDVIKSE